MGNLCSKSSDDNVTPTTAGRTLGSGPPQKSTEARAAIPAQVRPQVQGPGRTVGDVGAAAAGGGGEHPRAAAARAAEERANKLQAQSRGKLGEQLAAQKRQTRTDALEEASARTRGARVQDENANTRSWN